MSALKPSMSTSTTSSTLTSSKEITKTNSTKSPITEKNGKLQIFLGGSCNPTTWRQNLAIPFLDTHGISYYNPQVENWSPEIIEIERHAKQNAQILLFVIDKQTRSTVSLVESAFMAGENKNLVLVVNPYEDVGLPVEDCVTATSHEEFLELKHARYLLQSLVAKRKIPMFTDILNALYFISRSLRNESEPAGILVDDSSHLIADESTKLDDLNLKKAVIEDLIVAPPSTLHTPTQDQNPTRDIYIYLDECDRNLIETTALNALKDKGLTFSTRLVGDIAKTAIGEEIYNIVDKSVLLFVITGRQRGLTIMVLASHMMSLLRDDVVLCVQYLEEPCCIGGELLTKTAVADYNRGRVYLCDYAAKYQVPVFNSLQEAMDCCIQKCVGHNKVT